MSNVIQLLQRQQQHLHISASAIRCLEGCRREFWLRYVRGISSQDVSSRIIRGSAVHRALAFFYRSVKHGEPEPTLDALLSIAGAYITKQHVSERPILYGEGEDAAALIEEVTGLLAAFKSDGYRPAKVIDVERPFILDIRHPRTGKTAGYEERVVGELDLVAQDDDGSLVVVDHKAVGKLDRAKAQRVDIQMGMYATAARTIYGVNEFTLRFQDLISSKQPRIVLQDVQRHPGDETEVFESVIAGLELIHIVVGNRNGGRLMPRDRSWRCRQCGWRTRCEEDRT